MHDDYPLLIKAAADPRWLESVTARLERHAGDFEPNSFDRSAANGGGSGPIRFSTRKSAT
jgi:hypothetical protein